MRGTVGENYRHVGIDVLPEELLLEIFDFYRLDAVMRSRGGRPWKWHRLAHVCQRWRYVVAVSPRRLGLRILCKSGASIKPILESWPTLPIVVRYKGSRKLRPMPGNVLAALRHPDRVCEIDIGVTSWTLETMADVIQGPPFPSLERVRIMSNDDIGQSVLPSAGSFLGGSAPRLQNVHLDGVVFPFSELRQLLLSASDLVELRLCNITDAAYFSPDSLVTCLSALERLRRLEVHFHPSIILPTAIGTGPLPLERAVLSSLTFLAFRGPSEYLESLVASIDFPSLNFVIIKFLNDFIFEIPQLCQFIGRIDALKSPNEVIVKPSQETASITFTQRGERRRNLGELFLVLSGGPLEWQLLSATQIFTQLSPLLSNVKTLSIGKYPSSPAEEEDLESIPWLEFFRPFSGAWSVRITEKLAPDVALALGGVADDMASEVLPGLITLFLEGHRNYPYVREAAERFVAARRLSGHRVDLFG